MAICLLSILGIQINYISQYPLHLAINTWLNSSQWNEKLYASLSSLAHKSNPHNALPIQYSFFPFGWLDWDDHMCWRWQSLHQPRSLKNCIEEACAVNCSPIQYYYQKHKVNFNYVELLYIWESVVSAVILI